MWIFPPQARVVWGIMSIYEKISKLSGDCQIHPNVIAKWKKIVEYGIESLFTDKRKKENKEEDLPKLFKRFSRGKDVSLVYANGSGLGLYVSKIMVEAHQGKIWCGNRVNGQGAKFCFRIPISS